MNKLVKMAVAASFAGMAMASQASLFVVDSFTTAQNDTAALQDSTVNGSGFWSQVCSGGSDILGGCRDLFVSKRVGSGTSPLNVTQMAVDSGSLYFNNAGTAGGVGIVRWDGNTIGGSASPVAISDVAFAAQINRVGLGGFNLSAQGNAFAIEVQQADAGFDFVLKAYTDATHWSVLVLTSDGIAPQTSSIPFVWFLTPAINLSTGSGGPVDFSNLGALEAEINPSYGPSGTKTAIDLTLGVINIPEPGSMALTGLALVGLGVMRRRKQG